MTTDSTRAAGDPAGGFICAAAAFVLWGFLAPYMKALEGVPATEVVAHRIIWSAPTAGIILVALGRTHDLRPALHSPRTLGMAALTAALIALNWCIYVWAITSGKALEAALGYYINPLVNVAMGAVLLGERLSRRQMAAIALVAAAVLLLAVEAGGVPWISLGLAFTFAGYGYLKKTLPIGPSQGFFLEALILFTPALAYVLWLQATGRGHFTAADPGTLALLVGCGPITTVPLVLYAYGAKLLRYSTIGVMQYIVPTMVFLFAVFGFGETFDTTDAIAFGLIWVGLAIYTSSLLGRRRKPPAAERKAPLTSAR